MFSGEIGQLLRALEGMPVSDLLIEEPTLEEIFIHYYDDEDPMAADAGEGGKA
jgi:ABC-2 type transport system ATP-binding protein